MTTIAGYRPQPDREMAIHQFWMSLDLEELPIQKTPNSYHLGYISLNRADAIPSAVFHMNRRILLGVPLRPRDITPFILRAQCVNLRGVRLCLAVNSSLLGELSLSDVLEIHNDDSRVR